MLINRRRVLEVAAALPIISVASSITASAASAAAFDFSSIKTVKQFGAEVIGRADLSRAACEVALKKATRADAKEFAGFELKEAETVIAVLKELGTPLPPMGDAAKSALEHIAGSAAGTAFDTAYIGAEYENHAFLRDLAEAYLKNSDPSDPSEQHGRQLATVAHWAFWEHTALTQRIARELAA
ncbi:hypothetical protein MesoLj113a_13050 [Mesorhizobium sp. 113-1-2]|uniref:DUF4142 domain-containing protein n=1 Tax=Mesorhizobium sp. 113-1-2 TaxID=2744515 RepID=UPI0019280DA9|nr:DUF4142 domain-containing protein [Mesorhizobium sp. 113-1-2]BCG70147.1 hypothetical protein MesoLj113a_13050 [Mesorhizobium sp. 113-1-2]